MLKRAVALAPAFILWISVGALGQVPQTPPPQTAPPPQRTQSDFMIRGKLFFGSVDANEDRIEVRLEKAGLQLIQIQYSDSIGNFEFRNLQPGLYYVAVKLEGYEEVRQEVEVDSFGASRVASVSVFMNKPAVRTVTRRSVFDGEDPDVVDITQIKDYPKKAVQEFEKALEENRKGNPEKAVKRLEEAIRIAPDFYYAHNHLGVLYQKSARFRDAEKEFRRARELNPRTEQPLVNLGSLFIEESDARRTEGDEVVGELLDNALDVLEEAVKLKPRSAAGHYYLGAANYKSEFYEEAEAALKKALEVDPSRGHARLMLVNVYMKQKRWNLVLEHLNAYLKENPKAPDRAAIEVMRTKILQGLEAAEK